MALDNVKVVDDQLNELSKEDAFKLVLTAFSKTQYLLTFKYNLSPLPPNWLELLTECEFEFVAIEIGLGYSIDKDRRIKSALLHKFIRAQPNGFVFKLGALQPIENGFYICFDEEFQQYFDLNDDPWYYHFLDHPQSHLVCENFDHLNDFLNFIRNKCFKIYFHIVREMEDTQ